MNRRPLIGISLSVALGIGVGLKFGGGPWLVIASSVVLLFAAIFHLLGKSRAASVGIYILIILVAWGRASFFQAASLVSVMSAAGGTDKTSAELVGRIVSDVVQVQSPDAANLLRFKVSVIDVKIDGESRSVHGVVAVSMYGRPRYAPVYGEVWRFRGYIWTPDRAYAQRSAFQFRTGLSDSCRIHYNRHAPLVQIHAAREWAGGMLGRGIEEYSEVVGVLKALMLGYRSALPSAVRESFQRTGTMHVFAVSGCHVAILCTVIVFVLSVMGLPRTIWVLALAPLIAGYVLITGARASAIRAGIMAIIFLFAPLLRRRPDGVSGLTLAATVILLWNPTQIVDMGFLYSFAVVAGIMVIVPLCERAVAPLWQTDALSLPEEDESSAWWRKSLSVLIRVTIVSLAAWLTSAPLSLYFFGRFSPIAVLGNVIALPLAFLILITGCLSMVSGALLPWIGEIFNFANWSFVRLLIESMQALERIPFGWAEWGCMPLWGVFVWYSVLLSVVSFSSLRRSVNYYR